MISFFSNFISEHQIPFSNAMYKKTNGDYRFIATEPMSDLRKSQNFIDQTDTLGYVVKSYENESSYKEAMRIGLESDVVITGNAPDEFIIERIKQGKLTFRYGERYFKEGRWRILDPRVLIGCYNRDIKYRKNKNMYMLCCSAYAADDCRFIHSYPNRTYKWAYFTDVSTIPLSDIITMKRKNQRIKILWVSRFISLKHPEEVINLAKQLKEEQYSIEIEMVGIGELRKQYEKIAEELDLDDVLQFSGPFHQETVFEKMRNADIFLFTSDRQEGWGAVVNEAMTNACAVVACREIGSVPFLIEDCINGMIYDRRGKASLYDCVCRLIDDATFREELQQNAYKTMQEIWNADVASDRLLELISCIKTNKEIKYLSGPCSRA